MAGFSYQIARGTGKWHESRAAYLLRGDGARRKLCQVMSDNLSHSGLLAPARLGSELPNVPWLTPVLGSGCLEIGAMEEVQSGDAYSAVKEAAADLLEGAEDPVTAAQLSDFAAAFAEALVVDRIRGDEHESGDQRETEDSSPSAGRGGASFEVQRLDARVILVAALLSKLYFLAKSRSRTPVNRWQSDLVRIVPEEDTGNGQEELNELSQALALTVRHLERACLEFKAACARLDGDSLEFTIAEAVNGALTEVRNELLTQKRLRFVNLTAVTEAAWYLLAGGTSLYPGWTDLLFKLMLSDDFPGNTSTRPRFTSLKDLGDKVQKLLERPSTESWASWRDTVVAEPTARQQFFAGAAQLLWAEAAFDDREPGKDDLRTRTTPAASAFTVSFDLELEMALRMSAERGASYYVILPVQVLPEPHSSHAKLCWLRARYEEDGPAPADFKAFRAPVAWELVHDRLEAGLGSPQVVHLGGAPLIDLPTAEDHPELFEHLSQTLADQKYPFKTARLVLDHAVTIDEYLALQQAEAELIWSIGHQSGGGDRQPQLALPPLLVSSSSVPGEVGDHPRFWVTLGVPVADPAVRSRIVTQLTAKRLQARAAQGGAPPPPALDEDDELASLDSDDREEHTLAGVVVNRRISEDEGGILYWLGLDVVHEHAEKFVPDIAHYTAHLRRRDWALGGWGGGGTCTLREEGA